MSVSTTTRALHSQTAPRTYTPIKRWWRFDVRFVMKTGDGYMRWPYA